MSRRLYRHNYNTQDTSPTAEQKERLRPVIVSETTPLSEKSLEAGLKELVDDGWAGKAYIPTSGSRLRARMDRRRRFTFNLPLGCLRVLARQTTLFVSRTFIPSSKENLPFRQLSVLKLLAITIISSPFLLLAMVLSYGGLPPSYHVARLHERALPQHDWTRGNIVDVLHSGGEKIDSLRGDDSKYIRFPDHLWGHGLNNVLQEALLQALIAYNTNRTYVFEDFVWSHLPLPYTLYDFSLRPTRVPMGAFLGGWMVGEEEENNFASIQKQNHGRKTSSQNVDGGEERGEPQARIRCNGPLTGHASDRENNVWSSFWATPTHSSTSPTTTTSRFSPIVDCRDEPLYPVSTSTHEHGTFTPSLQHNDFRGMNNSRVSISAEYFEHVCPPSQRVEVVYRWPWEAVSEDSPAETADGVEILQWWMKRLSQDDLKDEKCVVIREEERRVWDSNFFGTKRPLSLFPLLRDSPILKRFRWSDMVEAAVQRSISSNFNDVESNNSILYSKINRYDTGETAGYEQEAPAAGGADLRTSSVGVVPGLVAIHLRRGDYKRHCTRLARWKSGYMGWNRLVDGLDGASTFEEDLSAYLNFRYASFPLDGRQDVRIMKSDGVVVEEDPDIFQDDANATDVETQNSRREQFYLAHCLPTIPQVVARLRHVREEYAARLAADSEKAANLSSSTSQMGTPLTQVYVLTNGWPSFLEELRQALLADGWDRVVGSVDLETRHAGHGVDSEDDVRGFTREEKGVSAAIDMGIADRAEVFLGNGFSSLSANVVMFRLAKGFPIYSNLII